MYQTVVIIVPIGNKIQNKIIQNLTPEGHFASWIVLSTFGLKP